MSFLLKVVSSVVRYGDPNLVHPLSLAAAHCMGEVTLSSETRESSHNYPNDTVDEVKSIRRHYLLNKIYEQQHSIFSLRCRRMRTGICY